MSSSTTDLAALTAVLLQTGHRPETSTGCQVSISVVFRHALCLDGCNGFAYRVLAWGD